MKNEELNEKLNELAKAETPEFWDKIESNLGEKDVSEQTVMPFPTKKKFPFIKVASIAACFAIAAVSFYALQGNPLNKDSAALPNRVASENSAIDSATQDKKIAGDSMLAPDIANYKEMSIAEIEKLFSLKLDGKMNIPDGMKLDKALVYFTTDDKETPYLAQLTYTGADKKTLYVSISIKQEIAVDDPKIISQTQVEPVNPDDSVVSSDGVVTAPSDKIDPSTSSSGSEPGSAGSGEPGVVPDDPTGTISNDYVSDEYKKTQDGETLTFYVTSSKADNYSSVYVYFEKADLMYGVSSENIDRSEIELLAFSLMK